MPLLPASSLPVLAAAGGIAPLVSLLASWPSSVAVCPIVSVMLKLAHLGVSCLEQLLQAGALPLLEQLHAPTRQAQQQLNRLLSILQSSPLLAQLLARFLSVSAAEQLEALTHVREELSGEDDLSVQQHCQQIITTPGVLDKLVQLMRTSEDVEMQG